MKTTNKANLPDALVEAVRNDQYNPGSKPADISVTTLIKPPRLVALSRVHAKEITEDAADRMWSLLGQAVHTILERASRDKAIIEKRFYAELTGWTVSGQIDRYDPDTKTIQDYKITSAYVVKAARKGDKQDFDRQLNMLAYLMRQNEYEVKRLQIVAILRDWSKLNVLRDPDYPRHQVQVLDIPIWSDQKVVAYLRERIAAHKSARETLPLCTNEERWAKGEAWAVMKEGRKSALRVLSSAEDAEAWIEDNNPAGKISIKHRPPVFTRCEHYCSVSSFCSQFTGE